MASGFEITFGSKRFDPRDLQPDLSKEDDESGVDRDRLLTWFVQFNEPLTTDEIARLRERFGLRLTDFVPSRAYIERLTAGKIKEVLADPAVRAVALYTPDMKIAPAVTRARQDNDDVDQRLNAVLFDDADPTSVAAELEELGAHHLVVLDRRALGGWATLQFRLPGKAVDRASTVDGVRWLEPVPVIVDGDRTATGVARAGTAGMFARLWDAGLHGEGQVIGLIDNGKVDLEHCFFRDRTDNTPGPAHRKVLALRNRLGHGPGGHATFVAGCAAGDQLDTPGAAAARGGAWASKLVLGNRKDLAVFENPDPQSATTLLDELSAAAAAGATIHSNSWHTTPSEPGVPATYDLTATEADLFIWSNEDHLVVGSSGNTGEEQGAPGFAKNTVCAAAASGDGPDAKVGDGAPGPTADGRRKPDLMAVGCGITSAIVGTECDTGPRSPCASSYATPFTAAAAALTRQYFVEGRHPPGQGGTSGSFIPSGALLKAVLVHASIPTTGIDAYPSDTAGWGLLQLQRLIAVDDSRFRLLVWDVRHAEGVTTGATVVHNVRVNDAAEPLRATLVWSDAPGAPGSASNPVVNNLDLEVTAPGGELLLGNAFEGGRSTPGGTPDAQNNVETVLVQAPETGDWTITVRAREVNRGNPGQGYALVASGRLEAAR